MRPDRALERLGGVADATTLRRMSSRARIRSAVRKGIIVRDNRGRFSLPGVDEALRAANTLSGVLVEDSAAQYYGWEMKHAPKSPCVAVPRNRKLLPERRRGLRVRYVDIRAEDVNRMATSPGRTVMDCASRMPFDEALAIADSALRHKDVTSRQLLILAEQMPDRYRARCLRVARHASGKAANPFESVLRAISIDVPGLEVEPQALISEGGFVVRPDLVDVRRRIVVEADSFEWHGKRHALKRDCERYNGLVQRRWIVLRFSWEHVMFAPAYVAAVLRDVADWAPFGRAHDDTDARIPA